MRTSKALWVLLTVSSVAGAVGVRAQQFEISILDYYGMRSPGAPSKTSVDACLTFTKGDTVEISTLKKAPVVDCLLRLPGVKQADINLLCCTQDNKLMLFVGISNLQKPGYDATRYQSPVQLSPEILAAYDTLTNGLLDAIQNGQAAEDDSEGHALFSYPGAAAQQKKFISYANTHLSTLRDVLKNAKDPRQRIAASWGICYHQDKSKVVSDLVKASDDPDPEVRNNTIRGLGIMLDYFQEKDIKVNIDPTPFVNLMKSIDWTDRNKSSILLEKLTRTRDPKLLELLRKEALFPLADMASWQSLGHAYPGFIVLGRVAGWKEEEIHQHAQQDREKSVEEILAKLNHRQ